MPPSPRCKRAGPHASSTQDESDEERWQPLAAWQPLETETGDINEYQDDQDDGDEGEVRSESMEEGSEHISVQDDDEGDDSLQHGEDGEGSDGSSEEEKDMTRNLRR